jgi:hypothetical protein
MGDSEDRAFQAAFLRSLTARGLHACSWSSSTPTPGSACRCEDAFTTAGGPYGRNISAREAAEASCPPRETACPAE